jgi:3alpha(or 20beta)-hydroxysteroid dehydrogenase
MSSPGRHPLFSLIDKVAVITGGTSGIGLATARRFAEAGATVVIAGRRDGSDPARQIGATYMKVDVGHEDQVKGLMEAVAARFGRIDVCINNAGIFTDARPISATTIDHMLESYRVNAVGVLFGMKHAVRHMGRGAAIINTSSLVGLTGIGDYSDYVASKFAIVGLTKVAAIEYGPAGIRVNCVCPSTVETPMLTSSVVGEAEATISRTSSTLNAIARPEEVAALMHFLAADDCPTITGQALVIDAGMSAGYSVGTCEAILKAAKAP